MWKLYNYWHKRGVFLSDVLIVKLTKNKSPFSCLSSCVVIPCGRVSETPRLGSASRGLSAENWVKVKKYPVLNLQSFNLVTISRSMWLMRLGVSCVRTITKQKHCRGPKEVRIPDFVVNSRVPPWCPLLGRVQNKGRCMCCPVRCEVFGTWSGWFRPSLSARQVSVFRFFIIFLLEMACMSSRLQCFLFSIHIITHYNAWSPVHCWTSEYWNSTMFLTVV